MPKLGLSLDTWCEPYPLSDVVRALAVRVPRSAPTEHHHAYPLTNLRRHMMRGSLSVLRATAYARANERTQPHAQCKTPYEVVASMINEKGADAAVVLLQQHVYAAWREGSASASWF